MSVKAMGLVWDLECPKDYKELTFKPNHKFVLIAYADHADHGGRNMYPAVKTIARKTGYDERSVQRITAELELMGYLVSDDTPGPRGTNRWHLSLNEGGDKIAPLTSYQGDENEKSLGDIPSGDIPSGDKMTPKFKEPEPLINKELKDTCLEILQDLGYSVFGNNMTSWWNFRRALEDARVSITGDKSKIVVSGLSEKYDEQFTVAQVYQARYAPSFKQHGLELTFTE